MFDLSKMNFLTNTAYSFVGIQRNDSNPEKPFDFHLPHGFELFKEKAERQDADSFNMVKNFFFGMYRTFKKYQTDVKNGSTANDRDGFYEKDGGFAFIIGDKEEVVLYSKLSSLDKILEGYDELKIAALEMKTGRKNLIDYNQIHRYLHRAIYLEEDVAYIEEMNLPRSEFVNTSHPIIQLFCYIYVEIKKELQEINEIDNRTLELVEDFQYEYLSDVDGLFKEDTFKETTDFLKSRLDEIDQYTVYKDEDYWHFYEAVESFLYGENDFDDKSDIQWGISNFSRIWESMCTAFLFSNKDEKYRKKNILFYEKGQKLNNPKKIKNTDNPFKIKMENTDYSRGLRPDLVIIDKAFISYQNSSFVERLFHIEEVIHKHSPSRRFYNKKLTPNQPSFNILYENQYLKKKYKTRKKDDFFFIREREYDRFKKDVSKIIKESMSTDNLLKKVPLILTFYLEVIDYKYVPLHKFKKYRPVNLGYNGKNKIKTDIKKQLLYEYALQTNFDDCYTVSHFWLPVFRTDTVFKKRIEITNPEFINSQIELYQVNFSQVQEAYISS